MAVDDSEARFETQRRKAFFADILAILRKRPNDLLSYEAARTALHANQQLPATTEIIPTAKVVGSVGRYRDFTRAFLPRDGADRLRWQRLDAALERLENLPPIDVFQVGDVYFVQDGNHRVSVARANGQDYIEARVTRIPVRVPLTADVEADEWDIVREYDEFLRATGLDRLRPQQRIFFSQLGRYKVVIEHIAVHRYFMGLELKRDIPYEEALADWYDMLYEPIMAAIRRDRILDEFPGRTEADLYLWIMDHHYYLSQRYGGPVSPGAAAQDFAEHYGGSPLGRAIGAVRREIQEAMEHLVEGVGDALNPRPPRSVEGAEDGEGGRPEEGLGC